MLSRMKTPKVSIITVNFNGREFLKNFFTSLKQLAYPNWELILVDNASTDDSVEFIKAKFPSTLRLIENKENLGFARGNNQAVKVAEGKYLFFLNNDTKIDPEAVAVLVGEMEKNPKLGIGGGRIMSYDGRRHFHTGIGIDIFGYPIVWKKIFYIEGSALMIRKELFERLGKFDPKYFMFHEDIDLAWRVWLSGYQVKAFPQAIVCHLGGGKASGGERKKGRYRSSYLRRYHSERNNLSTLLKNYQPLTLLFILPFYFLISLIEVLFCLIMFKPKIAYLYLKIYLWNLINLSETLKKRAKIQKKRALSDGQLIKKMYFGSAKLAAFRETGMPEFK